MSAKRAALLTVFVLFTMVVIIAGIGASSAENVAVKDGYGVSAHQ